MWVIAFYGVMILFAAFIVCRLWPSTQGTCGWGVAGFSTRSSVMMCSALDTGVWLVTVFTRVALLLTPYALRYVRLDGARGFDVDNFVLDDLDVVDIFVICGWFKVDEEYVERFFGLSVRDVDYIPHFVA